MEGNLVSAAHNMGRYEGQYRQEIRNTSGDTTCSYDGVSREMGTSIDIGEIRQTDRAANANRGLILCNDKQKETMYLLPMVEGIGNM